MVDEQLESSFEYDFMRLTTAVHATCLWLLHMNVKHERVIAVRFYIRPLTLIRTFGKQLTHTGVFSQHSLNKVLVLEPITQVWS